MNIVQNSVVTINYTLKDEDGNILDTTEGRNSLSYIHGTGYLIPGVEVELEGRGKNESLNFSVLPANAYGMEDASLIQNIPIGQFEEPENVKEGLEFEAVTDEGSIVVTVVKIENDVVTVDGNHPLAGKTLYFEIDILDVRDADPEEISSGEVRKEKIPTQ